MDPQESDSWNLQALGLGGLFDNSMSARVHRVLSNFPDEMGKIPVETSECGSFSDWCCSHDSKRDGSLSTLDAEHSNFWVVEEHRLPAIPRRESMFQ